MIRKFDYITISLTHSNQIINFIYENVKKNASAILCSINYNKANVASGFVCMLRHYGD